MNEWCEHHHARIIDTNKRAYLHAPINVKYFSDPRNLDLIVEDTDLRFETQPLYTIEIAENELRKVAEFESQVFNNMRVKGHYNLFEHLMEQKDREKRLRENYPAVKKAFEHYSLMLKLAESGEL